MDSDASPLLEVVVGCKTVENPDAADCTSFPASDTASGADDCGCAGNGQLLGRVENHIQPPEIIPTSGQ